MYSTKYVKPNSTPEALEAIKSLSEGKFLAGGMTLIPTLKQRLASPDGLVDISGCNLDTIADEGETIKIGAMSRHVSVAESPVVKKAIPALASLAEGIGDPQVRNRGTIGGSVANNDPAADYPAVCLALNATITTNKREITADDFFTGMFDTALDEGELITSISFPIPEKAAYMKFPNPASRYALVGVFVAKMSSGVRVAVTGAGEDGVFRASNLEDALNQNFNSESLDNLSISPDGLLSDIHAQNDYRASLIVTMAKRAVTAAS